MARPSKHDLRHERFAREYAIDQNGTRAAIAAGYKEKSARVTACKLLTQDNIQKMIAGFMAKTASKLEITAERVLNEIAKIAFVDPRKFFNDDGSAKDITELDDYTAAALAGFETQEIFAGQAEDRRPIGHTKKFKIADKGQNLERLGRYLKLFTDRTESSGPNGGPITVEVKAKSLAELGAEIMRERSKADADAR